MDESRRFAVPELFSFEVFAVLHRLYTPTPSKFSPRQSFRFFRAAYSGSP
jgi:hypothetical protein